MQDTSPDKQEHGFNFITFNSSSNHGNNLLISGFFYPTRCYTAEETGCDSHMLGARIKSTRISKYSHRQLTFNHVYKYLLNGYIPKRI